jgi:hypothetical protein
VPTTLWHDRPSYAQRTQTLFDVPLHTRKPRRAACNANSGVGNPHPGAHAHHVFAQSREYPDRVLEMVL